MDDIKVNLIVLVPGATIMSEQECSKQLKKPVINQKGKYTGKQAKDKQGNLLWKYETGKDLSKYDKHHINVETKEGKESITVYTRKCRYAKQSLNITNDAYKSFISKEIPSGFHAPKGFKPYAPVKSGVNKDTKKFIEGIPMDTQAWRSMSNIERLEWHLQSICENMNGKLGSYHIFED